MQRGTPNTRLREDRNLGTYHRSATAAVWPSNTLCGRLALMGIRSSALGPVAASPCVALKNSILVVRARDCRGWIHV